MTRLLNGSSFLFAAGLAATAATPCAHAQGAPPASAPAARASIAAPAPQPSPQSGTGVSAAAAHSGTSSGAAATTLGEIIVTAERREISVQKTPLSISVVTANQLVKQNVVAFSGIQTLVPSVKIVEIGEDPSLLIRGIGQPVANVYNDPSASFNLDGVPVARPISINGLFFDLARVEVLKGPQGTLYGRNSTSGAINIVSNRPTQAFGGEIGATVESYNGYSVHGVLNVPINDTLAVRVSFLTDTHDGYLSNGTDDDDSYGGRIKVLWDPTPNFSLLTTATAYYDGGKGTGDVPLKSATGSFLNPSDPYFVGVGPALNPADNSTKTPNDAKQNLRSYTYSSEANLKLDGVTLTLIPAYIKTTYDALTYNGGFGQQIGSGDDQGSIEGRIASNGGGRFKWIVGGIYLNDDQYALDQLQITDVVSQNQNVYDESLKSYAFFTQDTYSITSKLRLTGGLRYTHDDRSIRGTFSTFLNIPGQPVIGEFPSSGHASFSNVSYKVGLDYDLTPSNLLYANVSTGYKAGGFQPGLPPDVFKPETITAYAIGSKNRFFDRRLTLNLEAWYWDYKNFDVVQFGFVNPAPNFGLTTINAPKVKDYGIEAESTFQLTPHDTFTANLSLLSAKYENFQVAAFAPTGAPAANYSGEDLDEAAHFSGVVGYTHSFDLPTGGTLDASAQTQFETKMRIAIQQIAGSTVGGDHVTDANLTYHAPGDRFQVAFFVSNIENEPVLYFAGNTPGGLWGHPRPPRLFGGRVSSKF